MPILEGISAVKASLELAKLVSDRLNRPDIDVADVRAKVHEMLIHMVNAQMALGEAHIEISDLRRQLEEREVLKELDADMDYQVDGGFYIRKSEASKGVIAYCPICWKDTLKAIPMQATMTPGWFRCNIHKVVHRTKANMEDEIRRNQERASRNRHSDDVSFWGR
jgi:hypothetical protein